MAAEDAPPEEERPTVLDPIVTRWQLRSGKARTETGGEVHFVLQVVELLGREGQPGCLWWEEEEAERMAHAVLARIQEDRNRRGAGLARPKKGLIVPGGRG